MVQVTGVRSGLAGKEDSAPSCQLEFPVPPRLCYMVLPTDIVTETGDTLVNFVLLFDVGVFIVSARWRASTA